MQASREPNPAASTVIGLSFGRKGGYQPTAIIHNWDLHEGIFENSTKERTSITRLYSKAIIHEGIHYLDSLSGGFTTKKGLSSKFADITQNLYGDTINNEIKLNGNKYANWNEAMAYIGSEYAQNPDAFINNYNIKIAQFFSSTIFKDDQYRYHY